jgi:hypothetical protein
MVHDYCASSSVTVGDTVTNLVIAVVPFFNVFMVILVVVLKMSTLDWSWVDRLMGVEIFKRRQERK